MTLFSVIPVEFEFPVTLWLCAPAPCVYMSYPLLNESNFASPVVSSPPENVELLPPYDFSRAPQSLYEYEKLQWKWSDTDDVPKLI